MDAFLISQSIAIFWLENFPAGGNKSFIGSKNKDNLRMTGFLKEFIFQYFDSLFRFCKVIN